MLSYQRLDVYQCAIQLLALSAPLTAKLPPGYAALGDQLRRAALSIPLNIAEGSGRPTPRDASRFYGIARGSAMECGAILDAIAAVGQGEEDSLSAASRLVEMLTRMLR